MDRALTEILPALNSSLALLRIKDNARTAMTCSLLSEAEASKLIDEMREKANVA